MDRKNPAAGQSGHDSNIATVDVPANIGATDLAKAVHDVSLRKALAPTLGTVVYLSISGTAAETAALTAGTYELTCDVACWYRVNSSTGGDAAVVETAPARLLMAGETVQVAVTANGCINAITSGGSGVLGYSTVS